MMQLPEWCRVCLSTCGYIPLTIFRMCVGQQSSAFKQNSSYTFRVYLHLLGHFKSECVTHVRQEYLQF